MKTKKQILVIGGGAAGMMAAITASQNGHKVVILERNPRVGKKILVTGNGRCNFTNIHTQADSYHGTNKKFISQVLSRFNVQDTIDFFQKLGIVPRIEEEGKVFPMSGQASSVLDVLRYQLARENVQIITDAYVQDLHRRGDQYTAVTEKAGVFTAQHVILTTGGKAMPSTGSDGQGHLLAKNLGHTIRPLFPALVQLKLAGGFFKQIEGVKFVGTGEIIHKNKPLAQDRGDILFANYGISGPPILQISRKAAELLQSNQEAILKIRLLDKLEKKELIELLKERFINSNGKTLEFSLVGLINKRLIPVVLKTAGFNNLKIPAQQLSPQEQEKIAHVLTDWRFKIRGTKSWPSAQITAGGIAIGEINPYTMESKTNPGLFFAGEIMDVDGKCGGFNLQWAWSTGYIAGQSASR